LKLEAGVNEPRDQHDIVFGVLTLLFPKRLHRDISWLQHCR